MDKLQLYEPRCKICRSPNRTVYEAIYAEGKGYTDILREAANRGETINRVNLSNHFRRHYSKLVEQALGSEKIAQTEVEKKVKETLDLVEELRSNIQLLKEMLKKVIGSEEELTFSKIKGIRSLLSEIRLTAKTLGELTQKLQIVPTSGGLETEVELFKEAISRLEPELAKEIYLLIKEIENERSKKTVESSNL